MNRSRVNRRTVLGLLATTLVAASVYGPASAPTAAQAAVAVKVTVSSASDGKVGADFAGFSYEKDRIGAGMFNASNADLVKLFRLLGPGVLRLGGNLVDMTKWNSKGAGGSAKEIAPPDVTKLAAFLAATGWKAIYGINLKTNTTANAAAEAQFAASALGSSLMAFEIGNEPTVYMSESEYEKAFANYVKAIKSKVPGAAFSGPGAYGHTSWLQPFAQRQKKNSLAILSMHAYVGKNTTSSIPGMLASTSTGKFPGQFAAIEKAKNGNRIPQWRMTEANSYFLGGTDGVSNVQAAALWSLDFMHGTASHSGNGVNFHGGTSTQFPLHYSPIKFSGLQPTGVQAVYYGELLWALAGPGALHPATVSGGSNITAWGIGNNAVVNNKGSAALSATITLAGPATKATVYVLTAPSLTSKSITIGGSTVDAQGNFNPSPRSAVVTGGKVTVDVPAASAVLVVTQ